MAAASSENVYSRLGGEGKNENRSLGTNGSGAGPMFGSIWQPARIAKPRRHVEAPSNQCFRTRIIQFAVSPELEGRALIYEDACSPVTSQAGKPDLRLRRSLGRFFRILLLGRRLTR